MIGSIYTSTSNLFNANGAYQTLGVLRDSEIGRAYGQGSGLQSAGSNNSLNRAVESTQVRLSSLGKLRSALDTFRTELNPLSKRDTIAPLRASSSNDQIATAGVGSTTPARSTLPLVVNQLAQPQTLQSQTFNNADSTIVGAGSLRIETGSFSDTNSSFTANSAATTVNIAAGDGTLNGIARAVNQANAGVSARVVEANDGFRLQFTAANSGTANTLRVTAQDTDGNNANGNGLSSLAFDPAATANAGRNLNQTQAATNAQVTLADRGVVTQDNTVREQGLTLELRGTGQTTINVARDADAFRKATEQFVNSFNALQAATADQRDQGLANRALSQLDGQIRTASTGFGQSRLSFTDLGITSTANGNLQLDEDKLQATFAGDAEGASQLLSQTASSLATTLSGATAPQSELGLANSTLERSLASLETQRTIQQRPFAESFFGLPAQAFSSLFDYTPRQGSAAGAARYQLVAGL